MKNKTLPPALAGQVERGVRPHAEMLARRLQAAAYSHGYEDADPANATTRQAKTDAVSRQTLADLLIAIGALASQAEIAQSLARTVMADQTSHDTREQDAARFRLLLDGPHNFGVFVCGPEGYPDDSISNDELRAALDGMLGA